MTFVTANPVKIEKIKECLEKEMNGLSIKVSKENGNKSIKYLDLELSRKIVNKNHASIGHTWV